MTNYINMECAVPVGEMYLEYPTRSSVMFEMVRDGFIVFKDGWNVVSNDFSQKKFFFMCRLFQNVLLHT